MSKEQDLEAACKELVKAWKSNYACSPIIANIEKILNPPVEHTLSVHASTHYLIYLDCTCGWRTIDMISPCPRLLYEEAKKHLASTK